MSSDLGACPKENSEFLERLLEEVVDLEMGWIGEE